MRKTCRNFWSNEAGATAVYFAVMAPVLLVAISLGLEANFGLSVQRKLQHAADVAAFSGAVRRSSGSTNQEVIDTATNVAETSGAKVDDTITVSFPAGTGIWRDQVSVKIARNLPRYFSAYFSSEPLVASQRAVAAVLADSGSPVCMLSLSPNASGAITIAGSSEAFFDQCTVASNSVASDSFLMNGGSVQVTAGCVDTVGGVSVTEGLTLTECVAPRQLQRPTESPYSNLIYPTSLGTPEASNTINAAASPWVHSEVINGTPTSRFNGGLTIQDSVSLGAGLFVVDGGTLQINANSHVTGTEVSFYLSNGAELQINGTAILDLTAPITGPFAGLVFFSDTNVTGLSHSYSGNSQSNIEGAIYFPNGELTFGGNSGSVSSCLQVISDTITITGNSEVSLGCQPPGGKLAYSNMSIRLVQ